MPPTSLPGLSLPASPIALGTMLYGSRITTADSFALMEEFHARGGNILDTAYGYAGWLPDGAGCSERTIGEWLRRTGLRDQVLFATKGGQPDSLTREPRFTLKHLDHDLNTSLDRLRLPQCDLYWFHRDDVNIPVGELMDWAAQKISSGLFLAIGAGNWTNSRLRAAAQWCRAHDKPNFVASQIGWSLAESNPTAITDPTLIHLSPPDYDDFMNVGLPIFAYQAQARGIFDPVKRLQSERIARYDTPITHQRLQSVDPIAQTYGVTPNQVALAWFWDHPVPVHPVVGARTVAQLNDAMDSVDLKLSAAEWHELSRVVL